jgi:hypothetical protein
MTIKLHPARAQLLLPFAEREYVDMKRACRILNSSWTVIYRLAESGYLQLIDYRARGWKRVRYQSIVEHCDRLRQEYAIPDRRPPLSSPVLRHKDEDLLPFPACETIGFREVQQALGFSSIAPVLKILEEGRFECYRLHPAAPWRIFAPSFADYLERSRVGLTRGPHAYKIIE